MSDHSEPIIRLVGAADVRAVRQEVLRVGMPEATVDFDGDEESTTFHLAALDNDGSILAVSTWMSRPFTDEPSRPSIQLRGMATVARLQGVGLGSRLLDAGFSRARDLATEVIWANARDAALGFYQRQGFQVVGEGFIESVTRLPHHRVRYEL